MLCSTKIIAAVAITQIQEGGCLGGLGDGDSSDNKYFFNYLIIPGGKIFFISAYMTKNIILT